MEKRARIIAAARALFAQQGFEQTTTQQIADAAEIGSGTLFLYAKTKEDLLVMVFRDEMQAVALDSFISLPPKASPIDQIMTVFRRMVEYHERDIELTRILVKEISIPPTAERAAEQVGLVENILGGIAKIIRRGQRTGALSQRFTPSLTARSVFSIYHFGLLGWLGEDMSRQEFLEKLVLQLEEFLDTVAI